MASLIGELRKGDGLTTEKLRSQPELIQLLLDEGTAAEAKVALERIVLSMGDGYQARAVRNSLVISNGRDGIEARGGPVNRRKWATGFRDRSKPEEDLLIPRNVRTHTTYEDKGFTELARLILDRADARAAAKLTHDSSTDAAEHGPTTEKSDGLPDVEREDRLLPRGGDEDDDRPVASEGALTNGSHVRWWHRSIRAVDAWFMKPRNMIAVGVGTLFVILAVLVVSGLIKSNGGSEEASDGLWPSAPPATVTKPASESVDNTRGWGPDRSIFTVNGPASYPVFNSITNDPRAGDQRNFVQCRDKEDGNESYADELIARDGHTYTCFVLFVNAIAPNKQKELGEEGLLRNSRLRVSLPRANTYNPGVTAILSADNSITVWDSCNFVSPKRITFTNQSVG